MRSTQVNKEDSFNDPNTSRETVPKSFGDRLLGLFASRSVVLRGLVRPPALNAPHPAPRAQAPASGPQPAMTLAAHRTPQQPEQTSRKHLAQSVCYRQGRNTRRSHREVRSLHPRQARVVRSTPCTERQTAGLLVQAESVSRRRSSQTGRCIVILAHTRHVGARKASIGGEGLG